jgi:hypothetical protein
MRWPYVLGLLLLADALEIWPWESGDLGSQRLATTWHTTFFDF